MIPGSLLGLARGFVAGIVVLVVSTGGLRLHHFMVFLTEHLSAPLRFESRLPSLR